MRYLLPFLQASRKVGPVRDERKQLTNTRQRCKKAFSNCYAYLGLLLQSDCNKMPYESVNLLFDLSGMFFSSSVFDKVVLLLSGTLRYEMCCDLGTYRPTDFLQNVGVMSAICA